MDGDWFNIKPVYGQRYVSLWRTNTKTRKKKKLGVKQERKARRERETSAELDIGLGMDVWYLLLFQVFVVQGKRK